ncbi:MAG: putative protease sohB [Osedax symbiont Rs2]|nr:MAG: putative protease sohB [Osedax symbiont Rs2]
MVDFLYEYGMFLAKAITVIATILLILVGLLAIGGRGKRDQAHGEISLTSINDNFEEMKDAIESMVIDPEVYKQQLKALHKKEKKEAKERKKQAKADAKQAKLALKEAEKSEADAVELPANKETIAKVENADVTSDGSQPQESEHAADEHQERKRVFVLDFNGDIRASEVDLLREEISAVLSFANTRDEIVLRLDSAGGMVHSYGLAASQLQRIKAAKIKLTICVDEVAASGGYMMACLADNLIAAPFSILGSIGVVAQLPNFHRVLKKHGVDYETFTAGEYKRTVTMFGENTEKGKEKFIEEIQDTHLLFKEFVAQARPNVDIDQVATGEVWFGQRALEKNLVDELNTSDDFLMKICQTADVYQVRYEIKKSLGERLSDMTVKTSGKVVTNIVEKMTSSMNLIR